MRKYALHVETEGKAQKFVTNMSHKSYSYLYKHLEHMYGDGSPHVGYQEQYDTLTQHDDERVEEFGARWKAAFLRRFGSNFKIDTKKNMVDLIRFLANDYVKAHLAALKLRKFDDVMRHGRRLEKEAAAYGFESKFGPQTSSTVSYKSDYARRRALANQYAENQPSSSKSSWSSRPRWRNLSRSSSRSSSNANSTVVSAANQTAAPSKPKPTKPDDSTTDEDAVSDDEADPEEPISAFEDEDAQFICYVESELADIFEVAAKPNADKTIQERLRNDVAHLSVRINDLENTFRQKHSAAAVDGTPMYNTTNVVTGKCWNCGKEGHSWRRCPTRAADDKANLRFKPPGTDERITKMRAFTRNVKPDKPQSNAISSIGLLDTTVCSESTWNSLQVAATMFNQLKQHQLVQQTVVPVTDLVPDSIEQIPEDNPLMTMPRLFAVGTINTVEFTCLFDTGATTNLLSLHVYNTFPDAPPLTAASNKFHTAAGTPLDVIGRALCNFTLATKTTLTPFYVVRNLVGAALLGMPYLSQAGIIIHAATQAIQFAEDIRIPATTMQPDLDIHQVTAVCSPECYDCAVSTIQSLVVQPLVTHVTLNKNVIIPGCTAQIVEASIPGKLYVDGYVEPEEDVERDSGLLIARVYIPPTTPIRSKIRLWVVNIHDTARKLRAGQIAHIQSYDNDVVSEVYADPTVRTPNTRGTFDVNTQTNPDPRFPYEYLHVPVAETELPADARFAPGDPDHPDSNDTRKRLRQVPWTNTMLFPPPKLPRTPEDLQKVYDAIKLNETDLNATDQARVRKLFANWYYRRLVAVQPDDLGRCGLVRVRYDLLPGEHGPIRVPPRRIPPERLPGAYETVDKWLRTNTIQPSTSPFTFPPVFVPKPHTNNTKWRMCVDYRQLNDKSVKYALPLPRCDEVVSSVSGAKYFTTLDLQWGFLQMENDPETSEYTAFTIPGRHYHFNVLPFGVTNGPGVFQRLMSTVLDGLLGIYALNYIDDILITGKTVDEICLNMNIVFDRLEQANLMVGFEKVFPCRRSRVFLGFLLDEHGIRPDPEKVKTFQTMSPPQTFYQVRQLIGFLNFNTIMIPRLSIMLQPITQLLQDLPAGAGKKPRPNVPPPACELLGDRWSKPQQDAFDAIRDALTNAVALAYPDPHGLFVLSTDASLLGIGAILQQFQPVPDHPDQQELRTLAFASRPLTKSEHNYAATKLELLAVVTFVRRFHQYLVGRRFILLTDHYALQWLFTSMSTSEGIMARWITQLSVYDIAVFYRKGTDNTAADFLSRRTYTDKDLRLLLLDPDMHVTGGKSKPRTQDQSTQDNLPRIAVIAPEQLCEISPSLNSTTVYAELLNQICIHQRSSNGARHEARRHFRSSDGLDT